MLQVIDAVGKVNIALTGEDLAIMVKSFLRTPSLLKAFDIETTGLNPRNDKLVALQFMQEGRPPVIFDARTWNSADDLARLGLILSPLFLNPDATLIGANIKFDLAWVMVKLGIYPRCHIEDVQINEQIILGLGMSSAKSKGISFKLDSIASKYREKGVDIEDISKQERNWFIDLDTRLDEWRAPFPTDQVSYMATDVRVLFPIRSAQRDAIVRYKLERVSDLENQTIPAIALLETTGIEVDAEHWMESIDLVNINAQKLESDLHAIMDEHIIANRNKRFESLYTPWMRWAEARDGYAGHIKSMWDETHTKKDKGWGEHKQSAMNAWKEENPEPKKPARDTTAPNIGSGQQAVVAFNAIGIDVDSVSKEVLSVLEDAHREVSLYQEWKGANKLVVSFGQKLMDKLEGSRLYASYHQNGADTGRMSAYNPNLQQIPSKGIGAVLRNNIIPKEGYQLVVADFSNIELRILAEYSKDKAMLQAFASGRDLHSATAVMMFGLVDDDNYEKTARSEAVINGRRLGRTWRDVAKTINFGLVYGMSASKLGRTLKITTEDAKVLMSKYFNTYGGVKVWLDEQRTRLDKFTDARKTRAFSTTLSGRRRWYDIPKAPAIIGDTSRATMREAAVQYKEDQDEYRARVAGIRRQCANSPIQGSSADITKLALALWYKRNGWSKSMKLVGVVHDEIIIEARLDVIEEAQVELSFCMDTAQREYLKNVTLPVPTAIVSDHWEH